MNENNIYAKPKYKCGVCGEIYDSIAKRMKCEQECLHKQEVEAKKVAEAKKRAEKDARFAEASAAIDNAFALVNKCVEDYGEFAYVGKLKDAEEPIRNYFPSRLWHHFWF